MKGSRERETEAYNSSLRESLTSTLIAQCLLKPGSIVFQTINSLKST